MNQPGDPASCSFPITFDLVGHGSFQVFRDASGEPTRALIHQTWMGIGTANGKHVIERAAQNDTFDFVSGASKNTGEIHDQIPFGGVVIHDVGQLHFDGQGNLTFLAGPHQGSAATWPACALRSHEESRVRRPAQNGQPRPRPSPDTTKATPSRQPVAAGSGTLGP